MLCVRIVARAELVAAIGKPCLYCAKPMAVPTRDHIKPRVRGGTLEGSNKALACDRCNRDKGQQSLKRWHRRLRSAADPRADIVARLVEKSLRPASLRWRAFACA